MQIYKRKNIKLSLISLSILFAYTNAFAAQNANGKPAEKLETIQVIASADASKSGVMESFAGEQVATGSRVGVLGNQTNLESSFSTTSYTNQLVRDKQARSVGDVLQNDPTVRIARGFGNFQESYFIRGFSSSSDDTLYNGLYGILPRQYIATELFERVEVLRGASAFLNGMAPGGNNIGGTINILPKRAPIEPLYRITTGYGQGHRGQIAADIARRFGDDDQFGVRLNAAHHQGYTPIDDEKTRVSLFNLGLDFKNDRARLSADIGYQDNRLKQPRTNVTLGAGVTAVPKAPEASSNWAQDWTYSDEQDWFGTLRGEFDILDNLTAFAAYGFRRSNEANSLANLTVNSNNGDGSIYRFDNTRKDQIDTGEIGIRGNLTTGFLKHDWVISGSYFKNDIQTAYAFDFANSKTSNLYKPTKYEQLSLDGAYKGNDLNDPKTTGTTALTSIAIGDTLSFIDDKLLVTLGARWQKIQNESFEYGTQKKASEYNKTKISPVAGVVYRVTPDISAYANYVESLAPGETAPQTNAGTAVKNAGEILSAKVSRQAEVGLKYENEQLGAGLALFTIGKPRSLFASDNTFTQSGEDRHNGIELTGYGQVLHNLKLLGGFSFIDAKQKKTGNKATEDKYTIGVPTFQANISTEWEVSQIPGLAFDARVVHTGSSYATAENTLKVSGWTRFDVGVRYLSKIGGLDSTLRLRVDNLTNEKYWASVGGYPGAGYLNAGAPRSASLSLAIDF